MTFKCAPPPVCSQRSKIVIELISTRPRTRVWNSVYVFALLPPGCICLLRVPRKCRKALEASSRYDTITTLRLKAYYTWNLVRLRRHDSAAAANMTLRQAGNPSPLSWTLRLAEGAKISNKQKMVGGICGFADSTQTLDSNVASCGQGQPTRLMKWAACNSRSRSQWNSLCILHNQSPTASCGGQTGIDSLE